MNATKTISVEIKRFQPGEETGRIARYELSMEGPVTVLGLLKHIHRYHDSSLAFRWSCGVGKCGACGVRVNNKPVLACSEQVTGEALTIKPLNNLPVIKDLVVDRNPYYELREKAENIAKSGGQAAVVDPSPFIPCVDCLCCMSVCPVFAKQRGNFVGPAVITALARQGMPVSGAGCIRCGRCAVACAKGIDITTLLD